jgi:hypothetical protein
VREDALDDVEDAHLVDHGVQHAASSVDDEVVGAGVLVVRPRSAVTGSRWRRRR